MISVILHPVTDPFNATRLCRELRKSPLVREIIVPPTEAGEHHSVLQMAGATHILFSNQPLGPAFPIACALFVATYDTILFTGDQQLIPVATVAALHEWSATLRVDAVHSLQKVPGVRMLARTLLHGVLPPPADIEDPWSIPPLNILPTVEHEFTIWQLCHN
jgi:hypothetical protein